MSNSTPPTISSQILARARTCIILDHPFFASILLRRSMIEDTSIATCCVNYQGRIRYNPKFIESLTTKQAIFVLCHEILHFVGMDSLRVGNRHFFGWNYIADEWINDALEQMGIGEAPPDCVRRAGASKLTRETLYDEWLAKQKPPSPKSPSPPPPGASGASGTPGTPGPPSNGAGTSPPTPPTPGAKSPTPGNGSGSDRIGNDMEPVGDAVSEAEISAERADVMIEVAKAAFYAKAKGALSGILQEMVAEVLYTRTPWEHILERWLCEKVKTEVSWARPNRRYMPDTYMPSMDGEGSMGEMAVQIDISGSVSAREIAYYNGHLKRIVELVRPSKIHLLYTDTQVKRHEVYDTPEDLEITFYSGGGTDMVAGLRYLAEKGIDPVVLVTLTDGYTGFPQQGEFSVPAIWCISTDRVSPTGVTVPFKME